MISEQIATEIVKISPDGRNDNALRRAGDILRRGGLVVFPTETVYGLGANARSADACARIFAAKGRPQDNPLIVHVASPADAEEFCFTTPLYYKLAEAFMPGPITVIMPSRGVIPKEVTAGLDSVGVRCPSHPVAHHLLVAAGLPVAAPSANLSGRPSPTSADHVIADLFGRVDMIIDGGDADIGLESTIVKINEEGLILLRPGAVTYDALLCVCEKVSIAPAVTDPLSEEERPLSPGMKYRHYAPKAPLFLLEGNDEARRSFMIEKIASGENCLFLCYEEEMTLPGLKALSIGKKSDFETQGRRLFACLREADAAGVQCIYAPMPPRSGMGLALYNRLIRAAAHQVISL
ncbi:MAG: threonylcarbamoyl-AMP synthase [Clostridiales bacterium]|nr:threonylcarbamoyl-AMP synthase [Clostridiales bacterium]